MTHEIHEKALTQKPPARGVTGFMDRALTTYWAGIEVLALMGGAGERSMEARELLGQAKARYVEMAELRNRVALFEGKPLRSPLL